MSFEIKPQEMHCFASENQTYTGTVIFGAESLKSLKSQENLLLKNPAQKTPKRDDCFREICTRSSFPRMQNSRSCFVFVFCIFFSIRFVKYLSLYILYHSISVCRQKSNKILSEWLNNIVRGRLMYQMSAAPESQKRNDKRGGT